MAPSEISVNMSSISTLPDSIDGVYELSAFFKSEHEMSDFCDILPYGVNPYIGALYNYSGGINMYYAQVIRPRHEDAHAEAQVYHFHQALKQLTNY